MEEPQRRQVIFQPAAYQAFQRGIDKIVNTVRPTLGPLPRFVAYDPSFSDDPPELFDNGGIIARRIVQLADRDEDMGAMFIRHMLWRLHEQVGDGTATAAVLFQSLYSQGIRYILAGGNAQQLRRHLENGMRVILEELSGMTVRFEGKAQLARIAESICYDPPLAKLLGEIFDILGAHGQLDIRSGRSDTLEREYVEGMYWESGLLSRYMISDETRLRTELEDAAILTSDLEIDDPRELVPLIALVSEAQIGALLLVVSKLSDQAIPWLLAAGREPTCIHAIAVKTPGLTPDEQAAAIEDLAILTGGRPLLSVAGDRLSQVKLHHLGRARRAWADRSLFGVARGRGDPLELRQHIGALRAAFELADDPAARKPLQSRIGKLLGGSATLWVGGGSEMAITARKQLAERTAEALRGALLEGVVPGGGVALLACRSALQRRVAAAVAPDERAAYHMITAALEAPFRTIVANAGYDPSTVLADDSFTRLGRGFDVRRGEVVDMAQAGIFDVATVQKAAVRSAITGVALALTIDVLVHSKRPETSINP